MTKLFLLFFLLFSPNIVKASDLTLNISAFNEPKGKRVGVGGSVWGEFDNHMSVRFSLLMFRGQNAFEESDTFGGLSIAGFVHLDHPINPYVGLGLQASSTLYCIAFHDDDEEWEGDRQFTDNECADSKQGVLAIYPEAGVRFNLGPLVVSPFVRRYFDTHDNLPVTNAYGVSVAMKFGFGTR